MQGDPAVVAVAGRQHAVITTEQLTSAGLSHDAVARRVGRGWLRRMHRGVYLVGPLEAPLSRPMGAVLAVGRDAVLSHDAAGILWGLRRPDGDAMHVIVVERDVRVAGITVHRSHLHLRDMTRHHGIPVTSPARTLLDLAAALPQRALDRAVEQAQVLHLASTHSLTEQFRRYPRHRGTAALKAALQTDPKLTRSEAERRLLALIRAARLPEPEVNVRVGGHEVDLLWREQRLIVEVDGYAFHSTRGSFERDRRRDRALLAQGYRVVRVTWRDITEEPEALIAELAIALNRG